MLPFTMSSLLARKPRPARRRAQRAQEPADMGTAFGMEQWLGESDTAATRCPLPVAAPARPGRGLSRWIPRWLPRWMVPARAPRA